MTEFDRRMNDVKFHLYQAIKSLKAARRCAGSPAQHAVVWRMEQRAIVLHDRAKAVVARLAELRARAAA